VLIAVALVAILAAVAFPNYQAYLVRSSRGAARQELMALAESQERIFHSSGAYTSNLTAAGTRYTRGN